MRVREILADSLGDHTVTVAYWLGLVALAFPASRVADRVGRKKVFVSASAGLAFASVVAGFSANLGMLLGARALQICPMPLGGSASTAIDRPRCSR